MVMAEIIEQRFKEWTQGKNATQARISIYQRIRDIPYAIIPELNDAGRYLEILKHGKGYQSIEPFVNTVFKPSLAVLIKRRGCFHVASHVPHLSYSLAAVPFL